MYISHLVKMCAMYASSSKLANSSLPYLSYSNRLPGRLDVKINDAKLKLILTITSLTLHAKCHCVNATDLYHCWVNFGSGNECVPMENMSLTGP